MRSDPEEHRRNLICAVIGAVVGIDWVVAVAVAIARAASSRHQQASRSCSTSLSQAPSRRLSNGFRPEDSVVDSSHRAWEVPSLFVADGSVLPTQGSANPALAIMALSDRLAGLLKRKHTTQMRRRVRSPRR
jgi:choline dehydrogenase-like flavoprotein